MQEIIQTLNAITSLEDNDQLSRLDDCLQQLSFSTNKEPALTALFHLYERFPEEDGYGVCWSILHLLEAIKGYEMELVQSVNRQPADFTLLMVNRLLNADIKTIDGIDLISVLEKTMNDETQSQGIRQEAKLFFSHQQKCT